MSDISDFVDKIMDKINDSKGNNTPMIILQCVTVIIILIKPVFMYYIQAKYKADPPHESIRGDTGNGDDIVKTFQLEDPMSYNETYDETMTKETEEDKSEYRV